MKQTVSLVIAATMAAASLAAQSGLSQITTYGAEAGWKVPRTADGKPDLQGVWGNNSVTPMTRPAQWKNKEFLTDAEVAELQAVVAQPGQQRRRRHLRRHRPAGARRQGVREIRSDLVRPDHRQLQPVLDVGAGMGQPDVAHRRSA